MNNAQNTRVFIDSNIWFSAIYKRGVCSNLIELLTKKSYEIVISELVLEEVIRNIKEKIPDTLAFFTEHINNIKPTVVKIPPKAVLNQYKGLAHKNDLPLLASAIEYGCEYLITGNTMDFREKQIQAKTNLRIIIPSQFLKVLKKFEIKN